MLARRALQMIDAGISITEPQASIIETCGLNGQYKKELEFVSPKRMGLDSIGATWNY